MQNVYFCSFITLSDLHDDLGAGVLATVEDIINERDHIRDQLEEWLALSSCDINTDEYLKKVLNAKHEQGRLQAELTALGGTAAAATSTQNNNNRKRELGTAEDIKIAKRGRN